MHRLYANAKLFYVRDLSLCAFGILGWGILEPSPVDIKGQLYVESSALLCLDTVGGVGVVPCQHPEAGWALASGSFGIKILGGHVGLAHKHVHDAENKHGRKACVSAGQQS